MVKEMHQRHQVLLTLITSLVPVNGGSMAPSGNNSAGRQHLAPDLSTTIGRAGLPGMPSVSNMPPLPDQDFGSGGFDDDNDYGHDGGPSGSGSYHQQQPEQGASSSGPGSLKRQRDGDGPVYHDNQKDAGVEVDERGIIYMAGGRRAGIVPTKIAVSHEYDRSDEVSSVRVDADGRGDL